MKIKHALAALALGQVMMVGQASAACVAGNIVGTWYIHVVAYDSVDPGQTNGWIRCKTVVGSGGAISTTASQCKTEYGGTYTISAGSLAVNTACLVTGSFTVKENGVTQGRATVSYGQMDSVHANFSGLGKDGLHPQVKLSFQAVKQ